jgi:hypothetical protein
MNGKQAENKAARPMPPSAGKGVSGVQAIVNTPAAVYPEILHRSPDGLAGRLMRQEAILTMQQQRGNRYVLQRIPAVQRQYHPTYQPATTMAEYIQLVRALETSFAGNPPRDLLAMLRQVYYGRPWSVSTTTQWSDVLPDSPQTADPRGQLGTGPGSLFNALQQSQEVAGVDIGHVLTGLEAMLNPTASVEIEIPGPNVTVNMPNTEFATWGGDLGSAAGQAVADADLGRTVRSDADYYAELASSDDMNGNIDAYVIQRILGGQAGLRQAFPSLRGISLTGGTPLSTVLQRYYAASPGGPPADRYNTFAMEIGGRVSNRTIANRSALERPIAERVQSFAETWYWKEYKAAKGSARTLLGYGGAGAALKTNLYLKALAMTRLFFNWLESRLV